MDFSGAIFEGGAYFLKAKFEGGAYFLEAKFEGWAYFLEAKFEGDVNFSGAIFEGDVNFSGAIFETRGMFAHVEKIEEEVKFSGAILNRVFFEDTDLTKIRFYGTAIENAYLAGANFGNKRFIEEREAIDEERNLLQHITKALKKPGLKSILKSMFVFFAFPDNSYRKIKTKCKPISEAFRRAEDVYRNVKLSLQNEGDYETAGEFYYKEMLMRRKRTLYEIKNLKYWLFSHIYSKLCGYGEKPLRVILAAFFVILFFGTFYWLTGTVTGEGITDSSFDYYYFSVVTFTTLGFGDIHPVSFTGKLATMLEALTGAFMMALFVLVFGRKMLR
ncbi:MAG TPA: hypothetical protein ENI53_01560 [Thermoplasmatales archaeon]|nr:hypothetical protein [Thermoplasmatales archaeon]